MGLGVLVRVGVNVDVGVKVDVGVWVGVDVEVKVAVGVREGFNTAPIDFGADTSCPNTTQLFGPAIQVINPTIRSSIMAVAGKITNQSLSGCFLTGLGRRIVTGPVCSSEA